MFLFFAWMAETRSTIKVLLILYFVSDPESESESESIRSPESESKQPHHDSAPLVKILTTGRVISMYGDAFMAPCEAN